MDRNLTEKVLGSVAEMTLFLLAADRPDHSTSRVYFLAMRSFTMVPVTLRSALTISCHTAVYPP